MAGKDNRTVFRSPFLNFSLKFLKRKEWSIEWSILFDKTSLCWKVWHVDHRFFLFKTEDDTMSHNDNLLLKTCLFMGSENFTWRIAFMNRGLGFFLDFFLVGVIFLESSGGLDPLWLLWKDKKRETSQQRTT